MIVSPATDEVTENVTVSEFNTENTKLKCCLIGSVLGTGMIEDNTFAAMFPTVDADILRDPVDPVGYSKYPVYIYVPDPTISTVSGSVTLKLPDSSVETEFQVITVATLADEMVCVMVLNKVIQNSFDAVDPIAYPPVTLSIALIIPPATVTVVINTSLAA